MRKLSAFIQVSLDGYFEDADGEMQWAHVGNEDAEWSEFVASNAKSGGEILFGRVTYEMMASYWPTAMAAQNDPIVAERMNALPKTVFSNTLRKASWNNTKIINGDIVADAMEMKEAPGPDMVILGSGTIISLFAETRLIDEIQMVVNPIVLGDGRTPFERVQERFGLRLTKSTEFKNGRVLLSYVPV